MVRHDVVVCTWNFNNLSAVRVGESFEPTDGHLLQVLLSIALVFGQTVLASISDPVHFSSLQC